MKITFYGYNGFVVEHEEVKVAIDPGASLYIPKLGPVIPRDVWPEITHVVVTHADPDHYWHVDRVAEASGAPVICGSELVKISGDQVFIADPRSKKFKHSVPVERVVPMAHGDSTVVDDVSFEAFPSFHGELKIPLLGGLTSKTVIREADHPFAKGETAFLFELGGMRIANLGDSLKLDSWKNVKPDILMIPIGGRNVNNTMDEDEAAEAVAEMSPRWVIPCHYDCGAIFNRRLNSADAGYFADLVNKSGSECVIMQPGDSWSPSAVL